jgi:D-alanyl-D-alanine carboxypeptidase
MKNFVLLMVIIVFLNVFVKGPTFAQEYESIPIKEFYSSEEFKIVDLKEIDSNSYILMDSKTGQILAEKNSNIQFHPASTTKVMTALIALENGNLNDQLTASNNSIRDIGHKRYEYWYFQWRSSILRRPLNSHADLFCQ